MTFLVVIALSGWTLASYDFNLLILAFPDIAKDLHLTASFVGLLRLRSFKPRKVSRCLYDYEFADRVAATE